jgi:hypothetical protein
MNLRNPVTPETIATILARAPKSHAAGHELNARNPWVGQMKIGAVFVDQSGNLCVYTGIIADRRTKRPVAFTRIDTREPRCCPLSGASVDKIIAASAAMA